MAAFAARFNESTSAPAAAAAPTATATAADADTFSSLSHVAVKAMLEVDDAVMERAARTYDAAPAAVECGGASLCGRDANADFIASLHRWEHEQQRASTS
jgi:hypothetical protein